MCVCVCEFPVKTSSLWTVLVDCLHYSSVSSPRPTKGSGRSQMDGLVWPPFQAGLGLS